MLECEHSKANKSLKDTIPLGTLWNAMVLLDKRFSSPWSSSCIERNELVAGEPRVPPSATI